MFVHNFTFGKLYHALKKRDVHYLYHLTDIANVPGILNNGLQSYSAMKDNIYVNVANSSCQNRRSAVKLPNGRILHDYVPTFINPMNPMSYVLKQHHLCVLQINLQVLKGRDMYFTNGNAASPKVQFYYSPSDLDNIKWDVVWNTRWNCFINGSFYRAAEFLIADTIPSSYISVVIVANDDDKNRALANGISASKLCINPKISDWSCTKWVS